MTTPVVESLTPSIHSTADNNHLVAMPAVVNAGDLLVTGFVNFWGAGDTIATPSNWNLFGTSTSNTNVLFSLYYKIADGTEGGTTVDFVTGGANPNRKGVAHTYRISGWHGTTPPEIGTAATGSSVSPDPPTLTPSWGAADTLWLAFCGSPGGAVSAYPTSYTDGADDATSAGTAAMVASARRALNAASDNPAVFTQAPSLNWVAQTLAVRPAAAVPAAPTNLVATAVSTTQINLAWDDNATDETGFRVERSPDGVGSWVSVGTPAVDAESFSNTGLTCETEYFYRVFAVNGTGDSLPSNTDSATTSACPPPPVGGESGAIRKPPRNVTR